MYPPTQRPPKIKGFIEKVIQCPLQDIAVPLSGFRWEYSKGNFHHWRLLLLHFDAYFKAYLACRNDLTLSENLHDDSPLPKHEILQILRVIQIILENCPNKSSFDGLEHFKLLLASTDPEILLAALETLSALVKISPPKLHGSAKMVGCGSVNSYLLPLAQGWGSKEEGLGLYSCVMANEKAQDEALHLFPSDVDNGDDQQSNYRIGSTLYFEMHGLSSQSKEHSLNTVSPSLRVIHMPDLHRCKEDNLSLMKQCIEQHAIPPELRFSLLTRIRYAHAFRSPRICRLYSRICLLSFIVLVQSSDAHDELVSFFANEPEYTNELIRVVRSEETISGSIRTLAMLALEAQLAAYTSSPEQGQIPSGSSISFSGGNHMILLNVLQRAILSLKSSNDPSPLAFVEALLQFFLLHVVSTSTSGSNIRGSGMVPTFLPLLEDYDPGHIHLVCFAVKILQKLMVYSSSAVSLFKELGGIELLAQRLQKEVHRVIGLVEETDNKMLTGESLRHCTNQLYSQKRLIMVSLKALCCATYAPVNTTRSQHSQGSSLPATLVLIFGNVDKFGGDVYYLAVIVMGEIIHIDPTCFSALHKMGLPDAFLSSIESGILPSSKALICIPNGLGAICLNAKGLEAIRASSSLQFLVDIFTSKKYVLAMNEAIFPISNSVEELLRHVTSLRSAGVDIIIEIIERIASFGGSAGTGSRGKANEDTAMETDAEVKSKEGYFGPVGTLVNSSSEAKKDEQFIQLCVFHLLVLVHRTMENSETCRLFVEKSGIEALLKLLLQPTIAQSSDGMTIAFQRTVVRVFKKFAQHHSTPLARAFCSSLKEHLKKTLAGFGAALEPLLLDPRMTSDSGIFSSLFHVEFLHFLAASKDSGWVIALLTELGNGSKDVLEDIGHVHREVLWQIALLENTKTEVEDDGACSSDSQQADVDASETEEQRLNSFRQFFDPLLRRRASGWSIESQFVDLRNLYRDLGRSTGSQHRSSSVGHSNMQSSSNNQLHHSGSDDNTRTTNKKEPDKQRTYYNSCCDMVRSLSSHITHLFQELGKAMLLPSCLGDDIVSASPASKSVASTFASIVLDHVNFGAHVIISGTEASISTKCRYFGEVIDFMDSILMERPDSCNPILLNYLYGRGVIQSVLTTFEATVELLFAVNHAPASPLDTDDRNAKQDDKEDINNSWIYCSLASYGKLMDHLVTSSFILSSFAKHLLTEPLTNGDTPLPQDAETFVKILQSTVLKTVLPVWTRPQFVDCSYEFISTVISIIRHVYSRLEVKSVNDSSDSRITGPPPNETTISTIVEMGFSMSRAEEALRQVGSNNVELAMEWLFSHPDETPEDNELACTPVMSLGNSESDKKDAVANGSAQQIEEEMVQLPPVDELLSTCTKLLLKEALAFPVRDLLVMICSQDGGQYRSNVVTFIVDRIKECGLVSSNVNNSFLAALFHVLALILNEDTVAQEAASKSGFIKLASDLLYQWDCTSLGSREKQQVPKWVTTAFLALDRLLRVGQELNSEIVEPLKKEAVNSQKTSITIDEDGQNNLQSALGLSIKYADIYEQKRLVEVACSCMKKQLPSDTMHVVLLLCSNLTRNHSVALTFLDGGGLSLLLSLPTSSLFLGFYGIAASIVRHVLEDPQTLQQTMESEIKHSLVAASNRHPNGRVNPRNFLVILSSVISRDPAVFMQAAQAVCQVELVGERSYVVLLKDRDKDKTKEEEKDKDKSLEKDKAQSDGMVGLGNTNTAASGNGHGKMHESNAKSVKGHRKPTQSFINVVELLLEPICSFVPPLKDETFPNNPGIPASSNTDIDVSTVKGKGKAVATMSEGNETSSKEASASVVKIVFILKLLAEVILLYPASIHVLLRRDAENSSIRGTFQKIPAGLNIGGIFYHVLHNFISCSRNFKDKKGDGDWRQKLATRANQFMVVACVRSSEARKRVFNEISYIINEFVDSCDGVKPPGNGIQVIVDLLNNVLAARTPAGSSISAEASATFVDAGLVKSFTRTLQVLDLDHPDSYKVATGIVKALELVSKEHVYSVESNAGKGISSTKPSDQVGKIDNIGEMSQSMEDGVHHLPHPETDQDDHEIDDEVMEEEEEEEDDEEDGDGVIMRLEEGVNGINFFDHVEVFGRDNNNVLENNSLDLSLSSGRHERRMDLWTDIIQQNGGSNTSVVPRGFEELFVSQLRQPTPEKSSNQNIAEVGPHSKVEVSHTQDSGGARAEVPSESNANLEVSTSTPSIVENNNNANIRPAETRHLQTDMSSTHTQAVPMQFEHQTFGGSLRSLGVEIGSADGHDDGGKRQVSADRTAGDAQTAHTRRSNLPLSHSSAVIGRDASLHSVTKVSENSSRDADQDGPAAGQQGNSDNRSGAIDPAFLDALPEELRAEVLSAQQAQVAQPSNAESQNTVDIDPEFLAALPSDIRAEVLAQQQAQRLHQSQELEGQPVEMDTVSIIATFPSDLREEASMSVYPSYIEMRLCLKSFFLLLQVLLTSPDNILANLPPALVAEANMLRERFSYRHSRDDLLGMYPRSHRGEASRREGVRSDLDGVGGDVYSHRSSGAKVVEADGAPLVGTKALHAMIRLFRIVQPLYKGQLQRLLLNLCAHSETRTSLVKILMDLLMLDVRKPAHYYSTVDSPYRLYGCQSNVMYPRPQSFDGVPPLLSRRILETLTYLAQNHSYVAKHLLLSRLPYPALRESDNADACGKINEDYISIAILLSLLNRPLYLRSIAHLEQLLNLLDVTIDSAGSKSSSPDKSLISASNPSSGPQISSLDANVNTDSGVMPSRVDTFKKIDGSSNPTSSDHNMESESSRVLSNLPQAELRLLSSLLAHEGLSDTAYALVAKVMKKLVAIAPTHCQLFVTELAEAVRNLTSSAMNELRIFCEARKSLSTTSSDGASVLRVLQALSSVVKSLTEKESDIVTPAAISQVWEINSALEPLWHELSCCIHKIESYSESASDFFTLSSTSVSKPSGVIPSLPAGSQNILPYIESYFVVCEKLHSAQPGASHESSIPVVSDVENASTSAIPQKSSGPAVKVDEKNAAFVRFSERHRKLLNAFLRQNPGLLEKSFSLMLKVPRFIDFDNKRAHFRSKIKHQHDHHHNHLRISVRRAYVLEDSYNQLRIRSTQDLKGRLSLHFHGEEGMDAGGLTREWYQLLSRVIFDKGALLFTTVGSESTFQPNPNSVYQTEHLSYFKFVGRVVGRALFDGQLLDVHFTRSFYKHILGVKNDISDVLGLTFSIDADEEKLILYERTEVTDYELIPGGRNIKVTEENKHQYVDLVVEHRLTTAIRPQINAFLEGFNELIPMELISIFNDKELELLISGLPDIDLDDLRANTQYSGYSAASPVIQWFWEVVQGLSKEDKARLLQFVTGTSKVPLEGFSALQGILGSQKFQIHKAYGSPDHLPSAHTCFNQLDLPEYPSKQHLEERLLLAIHEASEGFGLR
ncbi:hypothetical protein TanjilG_17727 [Lupinus angustifolius]|uniref:HECT-type E3 ubiquitin transferase n=1 Tax=Lupinus angustifolius TaxID=3871 RepID=A0A394DG00_LUPAN|nr:hypothetical protein TanjilG_17727 [Lupinus angustifolius]